VNPPEGVPAAFFDNRYHLRDSGTRIRGKSLRQQQLRGQDRLIVALDVPTHDRAFELVDLLDNVGFFKIGLELLLAGDLLRFLQRLQEQKRQDTGVFVDLKLGGDIGNTIASLVRQRQPLNVKFRQ
jgi:orotidine-5'-phosphate decarboxylase